MKKIAIVGAGFAGVACAYNLKNENVTLFDPKGIGGGASGIAAGLLHPYAGFHSRKSFEADAGMAETLKLLQIASDTLNEPVFEKTGILRPTNNPDQKASFEKALQYPDITSTPEGIFISSGITVDCPLYLKGLFLASGARLIEDAVQIPDLHNFDQIIVTTGAHLLPEFSHLPIKPIKGQILKVSFSPEIPINARAYLVKNTLGATFERTFEHSNPCQKTAETLLLPKILPFVPELANIPILDCKAGLRAATTDHRPIIAQLSPNIWCLTGFGSKGLLHHALYAKKLTTRL